MLINELKEKIENKTIGHEMIVFIINDTDWIPRQYINEMSRLFGCNVEYYEEIPNIKRDIFGFDNLTPTLRIACIPKLASVPKVVNDLVIITKEIDKDVRNTIDQYVVDVPKLVNWQLEDYVGGMLVGLSDENIHTLCETCGYEIHRLDQEIKRLKIFDEKERNIIFNQLMKDGAFGVAFDQNMIFTFCDAIMKKDCNTVRNIYNMIVYQDIEPLGVVTILIKKFKQLADLQLQNAPTAKSCNMSDKQFWYLKKYATNIYTNAQVTRNLKLLTELDRKLKDGSLGFNASQTLTDHQFIDYVVTHIMCR